MKQTKWIALAGMAAMVAVGSEAQAATANQSTVSATGKASAKIVVPLTITADSSNELTFGSIAPSGAAGTVTVATSGEGTADGGCTIITGSKISYGGFNIAGAADTAITVTLPENETLKSGNETMDISDFKARLGSATADGSTGTLDSKGELALAVGAKLAVKPNQKDGEYTGTYQVSVAYN